MNKIQLTGAAIAIGAAAMFTMVPVFADSSEVAPMVSCKGTNSCKTATNECKGQGVSQMSEADCTKAGGTVVKEDAQSAPAE